MDYDEDAIRAQAERVASLTGVSPECMFEVANALQGMGLTANYIPMSRERFEALTLEELRTPIAKGGIRLCKYYSDVDISGKKVNYSRQGLFEQTVHLSHPKVFNDPFDCVPKVDKESIRNALVSDIASCLGIKLSPEDDRWCLMRKIVKVLNTPDANRPRLATPLHSLQCINLQWLCLSLAFEAKKRNGLTPGIVAEIVEDRVQNTLDNVGQCRIACFGRSPHNLYMWAHYANDHTGFCLEYETDPNMLKARRFDEASLKLLRRNMFNVFYCPDRPDATDEVTAFMRSRLDEEGLARFYAKILCFKSPDWTFEQELRLIVQDANMPDELPFLPARRVYLGTRMDDAKAECLVEYCREHGVEAVRMVPSAERFALEEHVLVPSIYGV